MITGTSKKVVTIFVHLLAWALFGFTLIFYHPLTWNVKLPDVFWAKQTAHLCILVILFYVNTYYFVPEYLLKNKLVPFSMWIVAATLFALYLIYNFDGLLHVSQEMEKIMRRPRPPGRKGILDGFLLMTVLLVLGISTSLAVIQRWQRDALLREDMEKQQIRSELSFLKAQINPHFFFNTLNNIYALSFTDVTLSRDALLKLSRMMRYLLYETQSDKAVLNNEISFLKDYIELMKLRLHGSTEVIFQEPKLLKDYMIAPMMLLPFIENAFKHGISAFQQTSILIEIEVEKDILQLRVQNNVFHEKNALVMDSGGIGLSNTKRRLDLLYSGKHKLTIEDNKAENNFYIELQIDMS
ncbi:sensor histidine kinase [Dyadobacter frigoris]|uniref:Histidine kinase n=1 Tax=Dyadobacter frigoris TaxID=2576211 RepID=A0A4U6D3G3_9BACT|nr:histidine kinase [Dyadobacter frigoris]TKT91820.1 histidine kinase [Dyadobacter frigoris]